MRSITSLACLALPIICSTALRALSIRGTSRSSHRRHASPNVTTVASGWFTSWAMEAVSSPSVVTRVTRASSASASRRASEASTCSLRSQRRVGHRQVAPAMRKGEPLCVTDFLSREAPVEIRLGRLLKDLHSYEVGYVHSDDRLRRHTPSPLDGWIHPLIPVISSHDGYTIG